MNKFVAVLLLLLIQLHSNACDCVPYEGDFCSSIVDEQDGKVIDYLSIYHVKVISIKQGGMRVEVLQTFHGAQRSGQELFIVRGNGADCIVITDSFKLDEELIVSIQALNNNWFISECGVHYLNVVNGVVSGPITINVTEVALSQFPLLDPACADFIISSTSTPITNFGVKTRPNPVRKSVEFTFPELLSDDISIRAFNIFGELVHQQRHDNSTNLTIQMEDWVDGLYLFYVKAATGFEMIKVLKSDDEL